MSVLQVDLRKNAGGTTVVITEVVFLLVLQSTLDNIPIAVFKNGRTVLKEKGYSNGYISLCCNGKKETAYGYKWKYITNEEYSEYQKQLVL